MVALVRSNSGSERAKPFVVSEAQREMALHLHLGQSIEPHFAAVSIGGSDRD